jgi:hypothetical protein
MISAAPSAIISRRFRTLQSCGAPRYGAPTFAHQVRDENSMIMAAANNARIDGDKAMMEASSPSGAPALTAADVFRAARGAEAAHEVRPVPDDSALWLNLVATTRRTNRNASPCGQVVTHRLQCDTAIANPARCEDHEGLSLPFEGMIAKVGGSGISSINNDRTALSFSMSLPRFSTRLTSRLNLRDQTGVSTSDVQILE